MDSATEQGVLGICIDAIELFPSDQRPDKDTLMDWLVQVLYMESCYEEHRTAIVELTDFYRSIDVRMMLLKGYGLSLFLGQRLIIDLFGILTFTFMASGRMLIN